LITIVSKSHYVILFRKLMHKTLDVYLSN